MLSNCFHILIGPFRKSCVCQHWPWLSQNPHHPWFLSLYYIFLVPSSNKLLDLNFDFVNSIQIRYWNQPVLSNECNVSCLKKQWGSNSHLTDYESNELPTASRQHSPCGFLLTVYKDCMFITHFSVTLRELSLCQNRIAVKMHNCCQNIQLLSTWNTPVHMYNCCRNVQLLSKYTTPVNMYKCCRNV